MLRTLWRISYSLEKPLYTICERLNKKKIEFSHSRSNIFDHIEGNIYAKEPVTKKDAKAHKRDRKIATTTSKPLAMDTEVDATSVLMAEDLPAIITEQALHELFGQYPGLRDLKLIPARALAFIEYESETQAKVAMKGLRGFLLTPDDRLQLKYGKKN